MIRLSLSAILVAGTAAVACGTSSTTDLGSPPDTITVTGRVVDAALEPLGGVAVMVGGKNPVTTDVTGRFTVGGVEAPYDAAVGLNALALGVVYVGLTRRDPVLLAWADGLVGPDTHYADISGTVTGGTGYPVPGNHQLTGVWFESPQATFSIGADPWTGAYHMAQLSWQGPGTITGTIRVLQTHYDSTTHLPMAYDGYGTRTGVTVSSGGSLSGQDVAVSAVDTMTVAGTVTLPPDHAILSEILRAGFGPAPTAPPGMNVVSAFYDTVSTFRYVAPRIPGATLSLQVAIMGGQGIGAVTVTSGNAGALSLDFPAPPELVAPADGAAGVTAGSSLTWHAQSGAIYMVTIYDPSAVSGMRLNVLTADTTLAVPDLGALGLSLSRATSYGWLVETAAPFTSVDQAAGSASFFLPDTWTRMPSAERRFTTAP
jgi:hypothetical protein